MSHKINSLEKEVEFLTKLTKAVKLNWRVTEVPEDIFSSIQKQFQVAGYNLEFCIFIDSFNLQIVVCPEKGKNYDKLKWPFKAEFVTHLSSQSKPGNIKRFKTEVFERKREDFNSDFPFIVATFSKDEYLEHFINGEAEFEIFVINL